MVCEHFNFSANVKVFRLEDSGKFNAEVRVNCADCGEAMQFIGLPAGININGATVSLCGLEARLALAPSSLTVNPLNKLLGIKHLN